MNSKDQNSAGVSRRYLPTLLVITEGNRQEAPIARAQTYEPGTVLVFDMAYLNLTWFASLTARGVWFVTRLKENADYRVAAQRPVPERGAILSDADIQLVGPVSAQKYPGLLRRVCVVVPQTGEVLTLLTNHRTFGPTTIARVYKDRWQIELFFKALKQHLRVKTFVGTSANALHTQIWTALIALLLLKYLQFTSRVGWSLSNLAAFLRMNLLVYRDLWAWLEHPFTAPPGPPVPDQTRLPWGATWTASPEVSS